MTSIKVRTSYECTTLPTSSKSAEKAKKKNKSINKRRLYQNPIGLIRSTSPFTPRLPKGVKSQPSFECPKTRISPLAVSWNGLTYIPEWYDGHCLSSFDRGPQAVTNNIN